MNCLLKASVASSADNWQLGFDAGLGGTLTA